MDRGTFQDIDGHPSIRFERTYPQAIDRVWAALVEPAQLLHWFPSHVEIESRIGGEVRFSGDPNLDPSTGTVLAWEPPTRLAFTWGGNELRFTLESLGDDGCMLTLVDRLDARNAAARNASGWTVCLAELDRLLAGAPGQGPHSAARLPFQPLYDDYIAAGMPSGAFIPH